MVIGVFTFCIWLYGASKEMLLRHIFPNDYCRLRKQALSILILRLCVPLFISPWFYSLRFLKLHLSFPHHLFSPPPSIFLLITWCILSCLHFSWFELFTCFPQVWSCLSLWAMLPHPVQLTLFKWDTLFLSLLFVPGIDKRNRSSRKESQGELSGHQMLSLAATNLKALFWEKKRKSQHSHSQTVPCGL